MSKLVDLLEFYIKDAWIKDEDGVLHPSVELLKDQGKRALDFKHADPKWRMNKSAVHSMYILQLGMLADCIRELAIASNMPASELRNMKVGSLCEKLQRVEYALRETEESSSATSQH